MDEIERIGDASREKWLAFLGRALELGYISVEEYKQRADIALTARTLGELGQAYAELPWRNWNDAWNKGREKGIYSRDGIHLEERKPESSPGIAVPVLTFLCVILGVLCIAMAIK